MHLLNRRQLLLLWQDFRTVPNINYVYILWLKLYTRLPCLEDGWYDSGAYIIIKIFIDVWGFVEMFYGNFNQARKEGKELSIISNWII